MSKRRNLLHANDLRFIDVVGSLSDAQWSQPSLCAEWSNHEVLAHLVLGYRASLTELVGGMARQRGSFDRANSALAAKVAQRSSPTELLEEFAALTDRPRGIGRVFPRRLLLGDHVIHELDIVFALGMAPAVQPDALAAVLTTQVRVPNPFVPAAARARGLQLTAADADWMHGEGTLTVTGGAAQLASVLAGRPWALDQLTGSGVDALRTRLLKGSTANPSAP
jgi:uncharacterized protein (TIGR03083 family)